MMIRLILSLLVLIAGPAGADTLVARHTLRAQTILSAEDIGAGSEKVAGAASDPASVIGLETRVAIYQGRPIFPKDLGPPSMIERNQSVTLAYRNGIIAIVAEGRALARGGAGDRIRVMNIASRSTVIGVIAPDGTVTVEISQ
jgi:flagella basal body P-ring formation protein FlgA